MDGSHWISNPDVKIFSKILGEEIQEEERSSGDLFDSPDGIGQNEKHLSGYLYSYFSMRSLSATNSSEISDLPNQDEDYFWIHFGMNLTGLRQGCVKCFSFIAILV